MFLLISGFLFYPSKETTFDKTLYFSKLKRRVKSLLVPYLLWNLIAYILYAINKGFNFVDLLKSFWVIDIPGRSGSSPMDGPLWYVRNLMLLMILSPIIYWIVKRKFVAIILLTGWFVGVPPFNKGMFIALTFFSMGGCLRYNDCSVKQLRGHWFYMIFGVCFVSLPFISHTIFSFVQRIMIVTGILSMLSIAKQLPRVNNNIYQELASATFFIYCCHDILLTYIKPIISIYSTSWLAYLGVIIISLASCVMLFYVITKFVPQYSKFLTGGR